ncbi:hypothetical protein Goarm_005761, partial [Gossypium armourianum]|nr:hypothetical protein [Gossypium armourianum]
MMVADFIVKKSRLWNEELIRSTFSMTDAKHILSIPLARIPQDDFLVWKGAASGEYSVRSAYKMPLQLLVRDSNREILGVRSVLNQNIPVAFAAEALAYVRGLQLGVTMGVREVEVEDLSNSFQTCVFLFGHRSKNEIAHLLATEGLRREEQWNLDRG